MKRISKIILAGAAIAVIGGFGARDALAEYRERDTGTRHYEQSGEQSRHGDRHGDRHADRARHRDNRHASNHNRPRYAHQNWHYRANYRGGHGYRQGWRGRPYARHINAAYRHGAMHCRPVSRVGFVRGHRALLGGVMCLDRHGIAFVIPQTRHVIHNH